jgi:N-acetylmuramoyl-L-alanine amidase
VSSAQALYEAASASEARDRRALDADHPAGSLPAVLGSIRMTVDAYEEVVRRFPKSPYADDALWHAAVLAADGFWQFGGNDQKTTALRLFNRLASEYPLSPLLKVMTSQTSRLKAARSTSEFGDVEVRATPAVSIAAAASPSAPPRPPSGILPSQLAVLRTIRRDVLPDALRITLELERETPFHDERTDGPARVFIDLQNSTAVDALRDAVLVFPDDVVRQIRVGREPGQHTRVELDLQGAARHSVYSLYDPYRVVVDIERDPTAVAARAPRIDPPPLPPKPEVAIQDLKGGKPPAATIADDSPGASWVPEPAPAGRGVSLSRQLGLGISRVVIDPGHGGRDPGATIKGLSEADLVLDVARKLERRLQKQPGVDVVLTRRNDVFVPLEERTALANRRGADLFLSIHANASANPTARGIETYFLNFAPDPEAEAIASRENAGSARTMRHLPDIVKAIAMNNKIDESRDFAAIVQDALFGHLFKRNPDTKSLGVKQAPFMVLVGATMPSVLAEISFLTNPQEASLLGDEDYREEIAAALLDGIMQYQKSLKVARKIAAQK